MIKFRGKRLDGQDWVYGWSLGPNLIIPLDTKYTNTSMGLILHDYYEVLPESVGQYVPREDFYEGDVLYGEEWDEYGNIIGRWYGTVKYDEDSGRIRIKEHFGDWYETDDFDYEEIIGNIHDNPELMEVE